MNTSSMIGLIIVVIITSISMGLLITWLKLRKLKKQVPKIEKEVNKDGREKPTGVNKQSSDDGKPDDDGKPKESAERRNTISPDESSNIGRRSSRVEKDSETITLFKPADL